MSAVQVPPSSELTRLAELHGVQLSYRDVEDRMVVASTEALLAALRALGSPISDPAQAEELIEMRRRAVWDRLVEPVTASFDGSVVSVALRVREGSVGPTAALSLVHESGEQHTWQAPLGDLERVGEAHIDGVPRLELRLPVRDLPFGYHRLSVEVAGRREESLLIVAPPRAFSPEGRARGWGAFLPMHALRTERDWGAGDLTDLSALADWVGDLGGSLVGTLPLLPVYLGGRTGGADQAEEPFDPSPYSPVSRILWNEIFVDPTRAPEFDRSASARELVASRAFGGEVRELRELRYVDWKRLADLKGQVLRDLAARFFDDAVDRRLADLDRLVTARPEVEDYARFRGAVARHGAEWWKWPATARDGDLGVDFDRDTARVHLYAQLLAHEQVTELSTGLRERGLHPYLDLPIGTRRDGYDVWRNREVFAVDADVGAPPDTIFTGGQNWRFPPLHPERLRDSGYAQLLAVLRHHLALADDLRIDHVMGLHRLFWIPEEVAANDGVYVRYPADEWYAIVSLESHRHGSRVFGENLGTVPPEVEDALRERGVGRMYVVQYEAQPEGSEALEPVPGDTVASVNTHDMPPFAAWWRGDDVDDGLDLGLLDEDEAHRSREQRARTRQRLATFLVDEGRLGEDERDDPAQVHAGLIEWLGSSEAAVVLANLEDLWLEDEPQNTPGTSEERPNWRRRTSLSLEEMRERTHVTAPLGRLHAARSKGEEDT